MSFLLLVSQSTAFRNGQAAAKSKRWADKKGPVLNWYLAWNRIATNLSLLAAVLALFFITMQTAQAQLSTLYSFGDGGDGISPSGIVVGPGGELYGASFYGIYSSGTIFELSASWPFSMTVLYSFGGADGWFPSGEMVFDAQGNLYTTTAAGGKYGYGTVIKLSPSGVETLLYSFPFPGPPSALRTRPMDGATPSSLVFDPQGNLFGVTQNGGINSPACRGLLGGNSSCGTVFEVTEAGTEKVLYRFSGGNDGANPTAGLVLDAQGNLYGTTLEGGANNFGTVFKLSQPGTEAVLHTFASGPDGQYPSSPLIFDTQGNLYGTTCSGGTYGWGTIFKVTPSGSETVLHSFDLGMDGGEPCAGLVVDAQGNFYGSAGLGGAYNSGTLYEMTSSGTFTVLYNFTGGTDGGGPGSLFFQAGGLFGTSGGLFGTTGAGGNTRLCVHKGGKGCGTIFAFSL